MTSSMLSGDRRWTSSRRSGKAVLGKVPKPINLPSQRLENHGMDPSVEIVPKGTLSWGSRSSSASTNAWGTSSVSPNTDGGTTSPSYLSGHISSGSRPSTAGSDKSHEPTGSAWGPNSRPSSASGVLTSNQTSLASLRPRSAEPRPGSSQLSRFAEQSEHSVVWSAPGTAEKLGVTSSKNEGFSLTSGDFPTLGSEKENSAKNAESQDHGSNSRPGSSSGGGVAKETFGTLIVGDNFANASVKNGNGNTWKRESPSYSEDGGRPGMERWQGHPQPYPPQHYDAWHGGPVHPQGGPVPHPQGGVWFRGPPGGPPFGAQVPRGGFPMEPFPYYPPQIPAAALANSQPVPPTGAGLRGHHPKNGEMYRPHMPDAYIHPGMPIRPGFYPGPVAFEGYYGSPMGYCNSNERDVAFVGMPASPPVYNRYPSQSAPEPGRPSGYGPTNQTGLPEKMESGHPHDTRGPYKVLLKQHDGWDRRNEEQRSEGAVATNSSSIESEDHQARGLSSENDWRSDRRKEGERDRRSERPASQNSDRGASSVRVKVKSPDNLGNMRAADAIPVEKLENEACSTQDITQTLSAKDSSLIQKIEGLNAKARVSDGRGDTASVFSREEQRKTFQVNPKSNSSVNEPGSGLAAEIINSSHEISSGISVSRRPIHGMHDKSDNRGRGRFTNQEGDGWGKRSLVSEPTSVGSTGNIKVPSNDHVHDPHSSTEVTEKSGFYPQGRREDDPSMFDPNDSEAQRAKKRELAKQRTRQLQEEEEERTRRQMAKARAKLEELNRRTQVAEGSNQKFENFSSSDIQIKQEESQPSGEQFVAGRKHDPHVPALGVNLNAVAQINEITGVNVEKSTVPSIELPPERPKSAYKEPIFMHDQPVPLQQQITVANIAHHNTAPQAHDSSISRQKQAPKQKQNTHSEKKSTGKNTSTSMTEAPTSQLEAVVNVSSSGGVGATSTISNTESSLTANSSAILESSSYPRRKSYRGGKNKQRGENTSFVASIPSSISNDSNHADTSIETGKLHASKVDLDPSSIQSQTLSRDAYHSMEQNLSLPNEDSQGRLSGQWKPQHSRQKPRISQPIRHSEKSHSSDAIWAPVRSLNKTDATDDAKTEAEAVSAVKSNQQAQNNSRNKRVEMERYVPKPVAKEMAHQGSTQQATVTVAHQTAINESVRGADSGTQGAESSQPSAAAVGKVGFSEESRNGGSRQNKQGKAHGSWRQRGSAEPSNMQGFQDGPSYTSSVGQTEQPKTSDDWNDGWNMPEEPKSVVPVSAPVVKEQGLPGRQKQHQFKGPKPMANNHDHEQKKNDRGESDRIYTKASASEVSRTELPSASKENQAVGERAIPYWQPKSQAFGANNHQGNRGNNPHGAYPLSPTPDKDTAEHVAPHRHEQYKSERNNVGEAQNRREKKTTHRGRPSSPNYGPVSPVEPAPTSMDVRQEHQFQTGFRRNGDQSNRFSRWQESRGDGNYSGNEGRQQNPPANRDRQRHSSHLEYQPVGPYNSSDKCNNSEGPREGSRNSGGRVKERGQGHSRRGGGNYNGRQSGTVRVVQDMD